jgi:uncharacterized protein YjeT (DUF2065 family)
MRCNAQVTRPMGRVSRDCGIGSSGVVDMSYIDVLIPGILGVLLLTSPRLFTKAEGEKFDQAKTKLRMTGFILIGVAILHKHSTFEIFYD